MRTCPKVFAFMSAPIDTSPSLCGSLSHNMLCGLDMYGNGTFTTEGITTLCEALKGSTVTSLECAAAPSVRFLSGGADAKAITCGGCQQRARWCKQGVVRARS